MPTLNAQLPDQAKPGDPGVAADVNMLAAAVKQLQEELADAVSRTDLTAIESDLQAAVRTALGTWRVNAAGAFEGTRPDFATVLMVGRDSSNYTAALTGDLRLRVADADF